MKKGNKVRPWLVRYIEHYVHRSYIYISPGTKRHRNISINWSISTQATRQPFPSFMWCVRSREKSTNPQITKQTTKSTKSTTMVAPAAVSRIFIFSLSFTERYPKKWLTHPVPKVKKLRKENQRMRAKMGPAWYPR